MYENETNALLICKEIDYYTNLVRIKKYQHETNHELDYQLKIQKNKLARLGIIPENYESNH